MMTECLHYDFDNGSEYSEPFSVGCGETRFSYLRGAAISLCQRFPFRDSVSPSSTFALTSLIDIHDNDYIAIYAKMALPIHKLLVSKILPPTPLNPKILIFVPRQSSDSKRSGVGGWGTD